jgi:hypothetical protein
MNIKKRRSALRHASRIESVGTGIVRYGLAGVIGLIAAEKFSDYEVNNIKAAGEQSGVLVVDQANWTAAHGAAGRRQ